MGILGRSKNVPNIDDNERKQLEMLLGQRNEQNQVLHQMVQQSQKELRELDGVVMDFCKQLLLRRFAQLQMAGETLPQMSTLEFIKYTKQQLAQMQMDDQAKVMSLLQTIERQKQQIRGMQEQISQMLMRERNRDGEGNDSDVFESISTAQPEDLVSSQPSSQGTDFVPSHATVDKQQPITAPPIVAAPVIIQTETFAPAATAPSSPAQNHGGNRDKSAKPSPVNEGRKGKDKRRERDQANVVQGLVVDDPIGISQAPVTADQLKDRNQSQNNRLKQHVDQAASTGPVEPTISKDSTMHVVDLRNTMERLNEQDWIIINGIAEQGLSVVNDLKELARNEGLTDASFNRSVQKVRDTGIVHGEKINIGVKWFWAYALTDLGHRVYVKQTGKKAVVCERERMVKDHTTAAHGYGIRETAEIMGSNDGVTSVTIDRKDNRMELPSKKEVIPDVIVTFSSGDKLYMEYELGHHTQEDFNEKCNRLAELSPDIVYVTPDQERFVIVKAQLDKWLEKRTQDVGRENHDFSVHLTTLNKLKNGVWEYEWPEPVTEAQA